MGRIPGASFSREAASQQKECFTHREATVIENRVKIKWGPFPWWRR
jgi:hypothetical protein